MSDDTVIQRDPQDELERLIDRGSASGLVAFLRQLPPGDTAYTISHLGEDRRTQMLATLSEHEPEFVADLLDHFDDRHVADMIEELEPVEAAAIVDEMDSDEQTDVLAELDDDDAEAILRAMDPEEARDARDRLQYDEDTAGGLMITEYLVYPQTQTVESVAEDLRQNADQYESYEARYLYTVDENHRFSSLVPMRRIVMAKAGTLLSVLQIDEPGTCDVNTTLEVIENFFDRVNYSALPVVDGEGRLVGVVQRAAVHEAVAEQSSESLMKFGGIIGGEELRSDATTKRAMRRLAFLLPNIGLALLAANVIAFFEPTIEKLTALAVFMPMVAGLCGAAGNQSVAVSIRELALGLAQPRDLIRVVLRDAGVGLLNGLIVGGILMGVVLVMRPGNPSLAILIGSAYAIGSVIAVSLGCGIPLIVRRIGVDPAMLSSPVLAAISDTVSFFLILAGAALFLHLAG